MSKVLITPYMSPDIDGYACAYAYQELMRGKGEDVVAGIFGEPHREAKFVCEIFSIEPLPKAETLQYEKVILVDASDLKGISPVIDPKAVVEIVDHRKVHEAHAFPNAKVQIELIGAAATLIGEKFYNSHTTPSSKGAALLYSAIVSNTINFKNNVTTDRDRLIAKWLLEFFTPPKEYIKKMFIYKSTFTKPLKDVFQEDLLRSEFAGKSVSIFQLEIIGVEDFIFKNISETKKVLKEFKEKECLDVLFLTLIDIFNGYNMFVTVDEFTTQIVSSSLGIEFSDGVARRNGIIMRKEIVPLIKETLEKA